MLNLAILAAVILAALGLQGNRDLLIGAVAVLGQMTNPLFLTQDPLDIQPQLNRVLREPAHPVDPEVIVPASPEVSRVPGLLLGRVGVLLEALLGLVDLGLEVLVVFLDPREPVLEVIEVGVGPAWGSGGGVLVCHCE